MTAHDFVQNYYMHDSVISNVDVLDNGKTLVLWIDFAFLMQQGYNKADPKTGTLKVTFCDVSDYSIPENVNWDEISIGSYDLEDSVKFNLMNDTTGDFLELFVWSNHILAEAVEST